MIGFDTIKHMAEQAPLTWHDPEDLQQQTFLRVVRTQGGGYAEILPSPPEPKTKEKDPIPEDNPDADEDDGESTAPE